MNKIWSNDSKVGSKALSNIVELIEIDEDLWGVGRVWKLIFEQDELMHI
jgi:hypothetical protein